MKSMTLTCLVSFYVLLIGCETSRSNKINLLNGDLLVQQSLPKETVESRWQRFPNDHVWYVFKLHSPNACEEYAGLIVPASDIHTDSVIVCNALFFRDLSELHMWERVLQTELNAGVEWLDTRDANYYVELINVGLISERPVVNSLGPTRADPLIRRQRPKHEMYKLIISRSTDYQCGFWIPATGSGRFCWCDTSYFCEGHD